MPYGNDYYDEVYAPLRDPSRRLRPGDGMHQPTVPTAPTAPEASPPVPGAPLVSGGSLVHEGVWRAPDYKPYEIHTSNDGSRFAALDGGGYAYTHGAPPPAPSEPAPYLGALYDRGDIYRNAAARVASRALVPSVSPLGGGDFERTYGTDAALRRLATGRGRTPTLAMQAGGALAAEQRERVFDYREQELRKRAGDFSLAPGERAAAEKELSDMMEMRRINANLDLGRVNADARLGVARAQADGTLGAAQRKAEIETTSRERIAEEERAAQARRPIVLPDGAALVPDLDEDGEPTGYYNHIGGSARREGVHKVGDVLVSESGEVVFDGRPDEQQRRLALLYADRQAALRGGEFMNKNEIARINAEIAQLEADKAPAAPVPAAPASVPAPAAPAPATPAPAPATPERRRRWTPGA